MMPINGAPIIVHLMKIYAQQGFTKFVLAAGHRQEILNDYFAGRFPEWKITIVDTGAESDTGERIRRCAPYLGERFLATYGDGLGDVDLHRLVDRHRNSGGLATLTAVHLRSQYGTVHCDSRGCVKRFEEKPVITDRLINAGFFVFEKAVFEHWEGQNLEADVFPALAEKGLLYTYHHDGFWKSMDTSKDQQQLEALLAESKGNAPWNLRRMKAAMAS
jgi:glucose-1-phosphate cytidylyltransferase